MSFESGRVAFTRFAVGGRGLPGRVDEGLLDKLREHVFEASGVPSLDAPEVGFTTGRHLLDTAFTYESCGFGGDSGLLRAAVRVDTHKVPGDLKKAYRAIHQQAAAAENPSGFATRAQKADAKDLADRQVKDELASGRFRKSKATELLWDLRKQELYVASTSTTLIEQVSRLMKGAFGAQLQVLSSGAVAGRVVKTAGRSRDWEDLHPSAFTKPPADAGGEDGPDGAGGQLPTVPWLSKATDLKDFLGSEFLLWLWHRTESRDGGGVIEVEGGECAVVMVQGLDLECAWGMTGKVSVRSDQPTRGPEARDALRMGKWPRKASLIVSDGESQFELTLTADSLAVSGCRLPDVVDAQSPRELLDARLELVVDLGALLEAVFGVFLKERMGQGWGRKREEVAGWIKGGARS
ncbi:MAG: hypothetical protein AAF797_04355 [Planctomycetota bacterium]